MVRPEPVLTMASPGTVKRQQLPAFLVENALVAIFRAPSAERFVDAATVLYEAGIRCLEFTLTTHGAVPAVLEAVTRLPSDARIGVGSVRTARQVDHAMDAGATFVVSQVFGTKIVAAARRRGAAYLPGALTPTEIVTAWDSGVPAVKVSPIGPVGGLEYFDQVRAPLPEIALMPTGGVQPHEVGAYLAQGAVAVGLSGPLLEDALLPGGDLGALAKRAKHVVSRVSEAGRG